MEMQLKDLVVFWKILLLKPSHLRQIGSDLEEYPLAPTSIANSSTAQPFFSITLASRVYLFNSWECHFSIFFSQGQVISSRTAHFKDFENKKISGHNSVSANWNGKKKSTFTSARRIQSEVTSRIPLNAILVLEHFVLDFTNFYSIAFFGCINWKIFQEDVVPDVAEHCHV